VLFAASGRFSNSTEAKARVSGLSILWRDNSYTDATMTKRISKNQTGRFIQIPFVVLKSESYRNLMLMQFNGRNNGDLSAAWSTMSEYGFKSKGTLNRSIKALLEANR
jgi:hypothetical protein